jgi:hypothetical protein
MSIDSDIASVKIHLGRIADALEALLAERGYVPTGPTTVEPKKDKGKGKGKGKGKETVVGKTKEKDADVPELKEVRAALKALQEAVNQAAVKSLLKKYGASTLGQLDESKYQRVIDDALEDADE